MCALPIFARWRQTLLRSHRVPGSDPARAAARDRVRQVLIIDACTPTPDRDSGSLRMLNLMHLLIARGCAVSFLAENPAHGGRYTEAMQHLGVEARSEERRVGKEWFSTGRSRWSTDT